MHPNPLKIELLEQNQAMQLAILNLDQIEEGDKRTREKSGALYMVRTVLKDQSLVILYDENGKPYLGNNPVKISISHSYNKLVVLFSHTGLDAGVDIEKMRDKVSGIRHKFLSRDELEYLKEAPLEKVMIYWCAKEAVYKASGIAGLLFAEHILVSPFAFEQRGNEINVQLCHPAIQKNYTLQYQILDDCVLVYTK